MIIFLRYCNDKKIKSEIPAQNHTGLTFSQNHTGMIFSQNHAGMTFSQNHAEKKFFYMKFTLA